ncbi:MAG: DUF2293 domain-containing protein [Myxococcales bacterium]|nr:DUF2293 domain-containing protein [Myxococcales bacterium]
MSRSKKGRDRHRATRGIELGRVAFERWVIERFPSAPEGEAKRIASYACSREDARVGSLSEGEGYIEHAVEVAVIAHIRHRYTEYEALLEQGCDRDDARNRVREIVIAKLVAWSKGR